MKPWLIGLPAAVLLLAAAAQAAGMEGWFLAGNSPANYEIQRDTVVTYAGKPSGRLASNSQPKGFGTMMQCIEATDYLGKRLRFSGYVKAKDVKGWAGLWMRVDGPGSPPKSLAFDNMQTRSIKGTSGFTQYSVVLDVSKDAKGICFGILVDDEGTVWLSGVQLEPVPLTVPVTNTMSDWQGSKKPKNLDFSR